MSTSELSQANIQRFNDIAATWDDKPNRVAMARNIAAAMLRHLPAECAGEALELGCGTGLITVLLSPSFDRIVAMDSSSGMLAMLRNKVDELQLTNVEPVEGDLSQTLPPGPFDTVISSMTLHHVEDVRGLLKRVFDHLKPGGCIALADLDAEDGAFHGDKPGIAHHGFDREEMRRWLEDAGFEEILFDTAYLMDKVDSAGVERQFPIFLVTARRPG